VFAKPCGCGADQCSAVAAGSSGPALRSGWNFSGNSASAARPMLGSVSPPSIAARGSGSSPPRLTWSARSRWFGSSGFWNGGIRTA